MSKPRLYASSGSIEGITMMINRFYYSDGNYFIVENGPNQWKIHHKERGDVGDSIGTYVVRKKGRYRFEEKRL